MKIFKDKQLLIDFIKFSLVGVVNTLSSYLVLNICFYKFNIQMHISNFIAFTIGVLVSFTLNSIFVFNKRYKNFTEVITTFLKTYLSYAFTGLVLTSILIELECNHFGIPLYIASLLNLFITVPLNFLLNNLWAYKDKRKPIEEIKKLSNKHSFVICAYKESPYLEECIKSLINQKIKTKIIMTTSTPNKYIKDLANKYKIEYYIRKGKSDIQDDWNFGYNKADTELVTIAHQDDLYNPYYTYEILNVYKDDILMYNTDYNPYKNGKVCTDSNSKIKKIIKFFVKYRFFAKIKFFRVLSLSFGNTVNCPSVTYNKSKLGDTIFTSDLKFSLDWDTFLKIAKMNGISLFVPKKLVNYRIHDKATTKEFINNHKRVEEDIIMFNKMHTKLGTKLIMKIYTKSYDTYN